MVTASIIVRAVTALIVSGLFSVRRGCVFIGVALFTAMVFAAGNLSAVSAPANLELFLGDLLVGVLLGGAMIVGLWAPFFMARWIDQFIVGSNICGSDLTEDPRSDREAVLFLFVVGGTLFATTNGSAALGELVSAGAAVLAGPSITLTNAGATLSTTLVAATQAAALSLQLLWPVVAVMFSFAIAIGILNRIGGFAPRLSGAASIRIPLLLVVLAFSYFNIESELRGSAQKNFRNIPHTVDSLQHGG